ncbi:condensin II non structural maintenance of chromosomes subunit [Gregarina niphandrodes]|uniref:Condensin II non structural maintenance of chromosomes subunit n=1 Tax=Gregarina niphandrodes TaxID=110365 RepID=A0A023B6L6_GRENI|nr:condensin II non structural maintenance of chromosomes subunit [Gregarina niphandrodes]EZG66593.1 condensin II non structural maintenance of chromosomes subunit [Gregarina niphandrodes]|eukprot:XP_011130579.1 condensin II non structural maintenance of chromosomes subunit [Gregarina niphandrodes]
MVESMMTDHALLHESCTADDLRKRGNELLKQLPSKRKATLTADIPPDLIDSIDTYASLCKAKFNDNEDWVKTVLLQPLFEFDGTAAMGCDFQLMMVFNALHRVKFKGKQQQFQKHLYQIRSAFGELSKGRSGGSGPSLPPAREMSSEMEYDFLEKGRRILLNLYMNPCMNTDEGRRFLTTVLTLLDTDFISDVTKAMVGVAVKSKAPSTETCNILEEYVGDMLYRIFVTMSEMPGMFSHYESIIKSLQDRALRSHEQLFYKYRKLLKPIHGKKFKALREFHQRSLILDINECIHAANYQVRRNSLELFADTFPLIDSSLPAAEYEHQLDENLGLLTTSLKDRHPLVRATAVKCCFLIFHGCWTIIPPQFIADTLMFVTTKSLRDQKSPLARANVITGIVQLVQQPFAQETCKELFVTLSPSVHDVDSRVRLELIKLVAVAAHLPEYDITKFIGLDDLVSRLQREAIACDLSRLDQKPIPVNSRAICEILGRLLGSTIINKNQNHTRTLELLLTWAEKYPGVLPRILEYGVQAESVADKAKLSAGLFLYGFRTMDLNPAKLPLSTEQWLRALEPNQLVLGCLLLACSLQLLKQVPAPGTGTSDTGTSGTGTSGTGTTLDTASLGTAPLDTAPLDYAMADSAAATDSATPADDDAVMVYLQQKFDVKLLAFGLELMARSPAKTPANCVSELVMAAILELSSRPGYVVDPVLPAVLKRVVRKQSELGTGRWIQMLRLTLRVGLAEFLVQYMNEWLEILKAVQKSLLRLDTEDAGRREPLGDEEVAMLVVFTKSIPSLTHPSFGLPDELCLRFRDHIVDFLNELEHAVEAAFRGCREMNESIRYTVNVVLPYLLAGVVASINYVLQTVDFALIADVYRNVGQCLRKLQNPEMPPNSGWGAQLRRLLSGRPEGGEEATAFVSVEGAEGVHKLASCLTECASVLASALGSYLNPLDMISLEGLRSAMAAWCTVQLGYMPCNLMRMRKEFFTCMVRCIQYHARLQGLTVELLDTVVLFSMLYLASSPKKLSLYYPSPGICKTSADDPEPAVKRYRVNEDQERDSCCLVLHANPALIDQQWRPYCRFLNYLTTLQTAGPNATHCCWIEKVILFFQDRSDTYILDSSMTYRNLIRTDVLELLINTFVALRMAKTHGNEQQENVIRAANSARNSLERDLESKQALQQLGSVTGKTPVRRLLVSPDT